jgi:hypothetical protein
MTVPARVIPLLLAALSATLTARTSPAQCELEWSPRFGFNGPITDVTVAVEYDDGSGPALFVGGEGYFSLVARWDGIRWHEFARADRAVLAMAVFDDGTGPALFIGSPGRVERWAGALWEELPGGPRGYVYALAALNDGSGFSLYAAGHFTRSGSKDTMNIARWDGTDWYPVGSGLGNSRQAVS